MELKNITKTVFIVGAILNILVWSAFIYVIVHFLRKWW